MSWPISRLHSSDISLSSLSPCGNIFFWSGLNIYQALCPMERLSISASPNNGTPKAFLLLVQQLFCPEVSWWTVGWYCRVLGGQLDWEVVLTWSYEIPYQTVIGGATVSGVYSMWMCLYTLKQISFSWRLKRLNIFTLRYWSWPLNENISTQLMQCSLSGGVLSGSKVFVNGEVR